MVTDGIEVWGTGTCAADGQLESSRATFCGGDREEAMWNRKEQNYIKLRVETTTLDTNTYPLSCLCSLCRD